MEGFCQKRSAPVSAEVLRWLQLRECPCFVVLMSMRLPLSASEGAVAGFTVALIQHGTDRW